MTDNTDLIKCRLAGHTLYNRKGRLICPICEKVVKERTFTEDLDWKTRDYRDPRGINGDDAEFMIGMLIISSMPFIGFSVPLAHFLTRNSDDYKVFKVTSFYGLILFIIFTLLFLLLW